jgi:hypothetical protein
LLFVNVTIAPGSGFLEISVTLPEIVAFRDRVGFFVGDLVGEAVGDRVGFFVGDLVREAVGDAVGGEVGEAAGEPVGSTVGIALGRLMGEPVGDLIGGFVGDLVGESAGIVVGFVPGGGQKLMDVTAPDPVNVTWIFLTFERLIGSTW